MDPLLCYTHGHVGFAAGVHGFSHRVDQVAADAEVAHLHLALGVDENVGGLDVCDKQEQSEEPPPQRRHYRASYLGG